MRPLVPDRALPRVVEARVRRALGSPAQVATATRELDFLLGASSLADQVEALVPTYLRHVKWRGELRWHPRRMADQQVEDVAPLAEARERGRGVLVSFMHHAYYEGLFGALAAQGQSVHPMVTPTMFSASAPGWMLQQRKMGEMGGPAINAAAGSDALREAMAQGKAVAVATDVPSSTPHRLRDRAGGAGRRRPRHPGGAAGHDGGPARGGRPGLAGGLRPAHQAVGGAGDAVSEQQAEVVRRSGGPLARLGRRIGWALAARLVAAVLQLVVVVLLARGLAPTEFAFVASVNVVLTALVALNGFGLLRRMQLMRARDRDDPGLPGLFALWQRLILGSAGVWLVLCALLGWWDTRFWLIAPFAAWLWFEQTTSVWNGISLADGRPQDLMPSYLWRRAPVALALVWAGGRDVDLVLVWSVASAAGALLAYLTALHRQEPWARVWWPRGRGPGRGAFDLAYWWSAVGVEVRDLDVAVLSWADAGTGALYALPARLIKPMNLVTVATASVVFPVLARRPRVTRAQLLAGCGAGTCPAWWGRSTPARCRRCDCSASPRSSPASAAWS